MTGEADLIHLLDRLETTAESPLLLEDLQRVAGQNLSRFVAEGILLLDYRQRLGSTGALEPITLCRLNRHHPLVRQLVAWD